MRPTDRLWIAIAFAGGISALTLLPLTTDAGYLGATWVAVVALAIVAIVGGRLRLPKLLTTGIQVVLVGVMFVMLGVGAGDPDLPWYSRLGPLLQSGYDHIRTTAAPMPSNNGVEFIFIMMSVLLTLTAGILADPLERPSYTLGPLLTMYLVPAIALRSDVNVLSFLVVVVGYLAILFADGLNAERLWPRSVSSDSAAKSKVSLGVWRVGLIAATPAIVGAVVLGLVLPTFTPTFFNSLRPNGSGPIEMTDPQLDLRENLNQPVNRQVLTYTTNKPDGVYLRQATLPVISAQGWTQSQVTLRQGAIGSVPGVANAPAGSARQTQIEIGELRSMYLPAPYAPRAQSAPGEWSWDPGSLMIISTGQERSRATQGLKYNVESWDIVPDGETLSTAPAGTPDNAGITMEVPPDVPASIVQLTTEITAGADTPALKAAAIQAYLRKFTYSVQGASGDTNYEAMETFLLRSKTGYCVQFAGSMALMSRIAGIPSRVAVGFLPGQKSGDHWVVNSHDMHAWPELYFAGLGWVRFEPTPSVASPPPWSVVAPNQPSQAPTTSAPSLEPTATQSADAPSAEPTDIAPSQDPGASSSEIGRWILLAAVAVAVIMLLLAPMLIRVITRRLRVRGSDDPLKTVDGLWNEIRDTWIDLGRSWPDGSPRQAGAIMAESLHDDDAATDALTDAIVTVERSRYAPRIPTIVDLPEQVSLIRKGLLANMPWDTALLVRFAPRSLQVRFQQWLEGRRARIADKLAERNRPVVPQTEEGSNTDDAAFRAPASSRH